MRSKFLGVLVGFALLAFAMPTQAASLTQDQINAVVNLLQSFNVEASTITHVQAVLNGKTPQGGEGRPGPGMGAGMMGSSTPGMMPPGQFAKMMCIKLNRNLGVGSQGDDVKSLQEMLKSREESGFTGNATGFFGPMTAKALMRFQTANGIASSSNATGGVGPMTRAFFERRCGNGLDGDHERNDDRERPGMMPPPPRMPGPAGAASTTNPQ